MRSFGRHGTYSNGGANMISNISKKVVSTDLDIKINRLEVEKEISIRESADETSHGESSVMRDKMKNMTTDEVFDILVKEHVDFRDIRYQELIDQFEQEMNEFKQNAPSLDDLTDALAMNNNNNMNYAQAYSQMQTKFYNMRKRDQKDLQERYERMMKVVRDSHVVEIQNVVSKFKGLLKETIQKKLDEQKLKYELEHKEMRDTYFSMKGQIRNLEEKCESLQEKINERDKRLQETYEKIMKMNSENSFKNADQDKLQKLIKEKDIEIEKLQKNAKSIEVLEKQKLDYALVIKDKENTINQKDKTIQKLQKQLEQSNNKINDQDNKIRTLEQDNNNNGQNNKTTLNSEEEIIDNNNRKQTPDQSYSICKQSLMKMDSRLNQTSSNAKSRPIKSQSQMQSVPISNFGDIFRKYKKAKREEAISTKQQIEQLNSKIKLKEDQIKLLQVEVLSLKEESDTYLQNLQSMTQQNVSKTQVIINSNNNNTNASPHLNDLILDPYRKQESSQNKNRLSMTEDSRYLQSVFSKNASQFNQQSSISPKLIQLNSVSSRNRNTSNNNNNAGENKENVQKIQMMNTTDLSQFKLSNQNMNINQNSKTPTNSNKQRQSLLNITNKSNTPDPSKKFCDIQVNYYQNNITPNNQNSIKTKNCQVQTLYSNTNLFSNNTSNSQYFSQFNNISNSSQQLFNQATPQIGNRSVNIAQLTGYNSNNSNVFNNNNNNNNNNANNSSNGQINFMNNIINNNINNNNNNNVNNNNNNNINGNTPNNNMNSINMITYNNNNNNQNKSQAITNNNNNNMNQQKQQKKLLGSYRIQSSYTPTQIVNNNYVSCASDSFIPLNI